MDCYNYTVVTVTNQHLTTSLLVVNEYLHNTLLGKTAESSPIGCHNI